MREFTAPAISPVRPERNLADLPQEQARRRPQRATFALREGSGWKDVTAAEFASRVDALAKGLVAAGLQIGDRVAIMSPTSYEWTLVDFAAWTAGLVVVPVYETSSPDQLSWILSDSGAVAIFAEGAGRYADATSVRSGIPTLREVWQLDEATLAELAERGKDVDDATLEERRRSTRGESLATIIYTSGTTGRPKGCMLTHSNFIDLSENAADKLAEIVRADDARTILFLPQAHVFARFIEVLCIATGVQLAHSSDIKGLTADLATYQPTFVLSVPRVFEKIYNGAEQKAIAGGKGRIFAAAAKCASDYSRALDNGGPSLALRVQHAVYDRLVYGTLRKLMGGRLTYAISGGAPLSLPICHFFRGVGIQILEGYGLTETTAPVGVNVPGAAKIGTVGVPLPGNAVRIADDGEILAKGIAVFSGYWGNEEATRAAIDEEGWFHTGDVGQLDDEGFLTITGRKKEIIVTAGGKNVVPATLEDQLRTSPLVSQCMVVGDNRPFVAVLITLDTEMLPGWANARGIGDLTVDNAADHPAVREELDRAVARANALVSKAESIRKYHVLPTDFTEANGYLTPSMKLKRNVVMKDFADQVEQLYSGAKE